MAKEFTKKVTVTMTATEQEKAKEIAEEVLGNDNISGLFRYWIKQYGFEKGKKGREK